MSFAFLALYTGDYRRDTQHLTPLRHGIYLLLLFHCWDTRGPAPLDEQECAGIANCRSADEIEALRYILARYFIKADDGYYNRRMQLEIERANAISLKRSGAGQKGAEAKAKQLLSKCKSNAKQVPLTPTTTTTPTVTVTENLTPSAPAEKISPVAGGWQGITDEDMALWAAAYPAIPVSNELLKARAWIEANPKNRKSNYKRFLIGWFTRAQDAARPVGGGSRRSKELAL